MLRCIWKRSEEERLSTSQNSYTCTVQYSGENRDSLLFSNYEISGNIFPSKRAIVKSANI
jgi:hypothetical protein